MGKVRLDALLYERGLFESREKARAVIMSGAVYIGGKRVDKPGAQVAPDSAVEVRQTAPRYVSRGGLKLEKALAVFPVSPEGKICMDCGASTGGFTDCMLQNGAKKVYAVDVGYGQLDWRLRNDPRVVSMERTNARYLTTSDISEEIGFATVDVSFISLKHILPVIAALLAPDGQAVCLVKPQFEAGRGLVGKKGVVRDPNVHVQVLEQFLAHAASAGFVVNGLVASPIKGPEGNIEYLGHVSKAGAEAAGGPIAGDSGRDAIKALVEKTHREI